ncbi:uncharacterized protein LOC111897707 [Lactuca sativa]|uniref:uncharacterized protein LOC111897707 n=1 Tax=Lactuca sativa TaxID=4236 RepID=UPI000CD8514A|nr:uncharacterized protein LOC111897707 [Lactuca sativa]
MKILRLSSDFGALLLKKKTIEESGVAFKLMDLETSSLCASFEGTFLVNYAPALVLFDSGAIRSFVSSSFYRGFSFVWEALSRPLRVSIPDERPISATDIYRCGVLEIFGVGYPIDLIPITMGDVCVIVGMDWLSWFGALVNLDTWDDEKKSISISDVFVVRDFPVVFHEELPIVHPMMQVEFWIDLMSGAAPIVKASYHLAPPEM